MQYLAMGGLTHEIKQNNDLYVLRSYFDLPIQHPEPRAYTNHGFFADFNVGSIMTHFGVRERAYTQSSGIAFRRWFAEWFSSEILHIDVRF